MIAHPLLPDVSLRATIPSQAREWRNEYAIRKWCRQYTLISHAQHEAWLERIETDPTIKMFGIWAEAGVHGFVGVCGLTSINRVNQTAEFSLYIAHEHQRKGFARKALTLLLLHGFWDMNLNRIWGESFDGNPAIKLFIDVRMWCEGSLRQTYYREGRFIDSHLFSLTREEFNACYLDRLGDRNERAGGGSEPDIGGGESDDLKPAAEASGRPFGRADIVTAEDFDKLEEYFAATGPLG